MPAGQLTAVGLCVIGGAEACPPWSGHTLVVEWTAPSALLPPNTPTPQELSPLKQRLGSFAHDQGVKEV